MKKALASLALASTLIINAVAPAFAGTFQGFGGVAVTSPDTYAACTATSDTIAITGLTNLNTTYANPDIDFTVEGWVRVEFVQPDGSRQLVPGGFQSVNTAVDTQLTVNYPSVDTWPVTDPANNTREIHVDFALELVARNTVNGIIEFLPPTFGPSIDWDVFCQGYNPPPPPPSNPGTGTPGYWKNHPQAWPVTSITLGGITYTQAQALAWLDMSDGDKRVTMFRTLLATKLNVIIGNTSTCVDSTIAAADAWWAQNHASRVRANSAAWAVGSPLQTTLDNYNNGLLCAPAR